MDAKWTVFCGVMLYEIVNSFESYNICEEKNVLRCMK